MRDDVLIQLTDKVMQDAEFRGRLRNDLEGSLAAEGFQLNDEELSAVRAFHGETAGLSDAELQTALADSGKRQFAA
jgi:hypothetical protein